MASPGPTLWRRDTRPGVLVVAAGSAAMLFLGLVFVVLVSPAFVAFDEAASSFFRSIDIAWFGPFFAAATRIGDFMVMFVATLVAVVALSLRGSRVEATLFGLTMMLGTSVGWLAKELIERSRPGLEYARIVLPDSYSFPSGHSLATFLFCALIAFIVSLEAKSLRTREIVFTVCVAVPLLVGASRVYLGVHWFGDVLASWILGFGIMSAAASLYFNFTPGE